jgi:archaellum component FlaC
MMNDMTIDRTELEELMDDYCDFHKDVYGVKARWIYGQQVTVEEMKEMLARLEREYKAQVEEKKQRTAQAEEAAREQIRILMQHGAKDVAMAIRWLHDAQDTGGDNRFLDFELGVEYGFIDSLLVNGL